MTESHKNSNHSSTMYPKPLQHLKEQIWDGQMGDSLVSLTHLEMDVPRMISCQHILKGKKHWLVVWNMAFNFPYIGNNHPNWLTPSFFRGVGQPPTRKGNKQMDPLYLCNPFGCPGRKNEQDDQRFGGWEVLWLRTCLLFLIGAHGDGSRWLWRYHFWWNKHPYISINLG